MAMPNWKAPGEIVARGFAATSGSSIPYVRTSSPLPSGFVHRLTAPSPYAHTLAQLRHLGALRPGWNGHDAAAVQSQSVLRAAEFLNLLHTMYQAMVAPPIVGPLPDGGVVLVWRREKKEVEISFVDRGESIETAVTDRTGERPEEFHEGVALERLLSDFVPDHLIGG